MTFYLVQSVDSEGTITVSAIPETDLVLNNEYRILLADNPLCLYFSSHPFHVC